MKLAKSLERLGTESAFTVLAEAKKLEAQGKPMIHLGLGQPDFKTPKHVGLPPGMIKILSNISGGPKLFQLYVHKDQSITDDLIDRCKRSGFNGMCLTVDTLVAGNRERDHLIVHVCQ